MPVSRLTAEGLSAEVAAVYARAEVRLLQLIGKHLAAGTESPEWAEAKLAELQVFRRRAAKIVEAATAEAVGQVSSVTQTAYLRGAAAGEDELGALGIDTADLAPQHAEFSVRALVRALADALDAMAPQIVRHAADGYRDAVTRASSGTLTGASTRLQDAQVALDDLARRGLSGFTDKAGRRWGLESYVEMATRTTTAQAAVAGHMDRLEQAGISLFIVSDSPRECEVCRPWEGKVLTRGTADAVATNALTGKTERVRVDGTLQRAMSAGLFHPNCTHNLSAYVHGATKRRAAAADPKGNAEKVHQRHLERKVREWKRREAVAITPEAARAAKAKVREWQAAVAEHTKATGLPRKRNRESLTAAR